MWSNVKEIDNSLDGITGSYLPNKLVTTSKLYV